MLMMVDPNVHFHVIPRYSKPRQWRKIQFVDACWPGPPNLASAIQLSSRDLAELTRDLAARFC
jgi:diadenosine tetraphosphate (Ap4A) HIT family hydrolase